MKAFTLAAIGITLSALLLGSASPALAHDELVGFDVVTSNDSPEVTGVSLQFSNEILDVGAEFIGVDATGSDVLAGPPVVAGRDVSQSLKTPLAPGEVSLAWRVVSSDGHPITGALTLTVAQDGSGTIAETEMAPATDGAAGEDESAAPVQAAGDSAGADPNAVQPWVWALAAFGALGAAAAIIVALIIGSRKRAQALGGDGLSPGSTPTTD